VLAVAVLLDAEVDHPLTREERLTQDGAVNPILFYRPRDPWGCFSNFSRHGVWLPHPWTGERVFYPTTEHRFQCMKACRAEDHDYVLAAANPTEAKHRGGPQGIALIDGWDSSYRGFAYYAMFEALVAKTLQHEDVSGALVDSGLRHIYEDSAVDDIWGWRYRNDHRGKNLLGRCWMDVRALAR
jgi:ribA/ribD-fused uncharacterized protein